MNIEPEIPLSEKFANNGLKPLKFMVDITKGRICHVQGKTLSNGSKINADQDDEPILDKVKSFLKEIWPFADSKDAELPSPIPQMQMNHNSLNLEEDPFQKKPNASLMPRRSDSLESQQSQFKVENNFDLLVNLTDKMGAKNSSKSSQKDYPMFQERMNDFLNHPISKSFCENNKEFLQYLYLKNSLVKNLLKNEKFNILKKGVPPKSNDCFICDNDAKLKQSNHPVISQ